MKKYIKLWSMLLLCISWFTNVLAQKSHTDKNGWLLTMDSVNLYAMTKPIVKDNIFEDTNYNIWCGSVIKAENGKFYMFYSRWPITTGHKGWITNSEIALAKADNPGGPYKHVKVLLPARENKFWDSNTTHNPAAIYYKGKYYLYYVGTTKNVDQNADASTKWWLYRNSQRIGVAVATNPEGNWERFDKPVIDVSPDSTAYDALMMANPAITVGNDGKVVLVYKEVEKLPGQLRGGKVRFGIAFSKSLLGPFAKHDQPIFQSYDKAAKNSWMIAEDPFLWNYNNKYYAIVRDVTGLFTKGKSALAMLSSINGIIWNPTPYPSVVPKQLVFEDGRKQDDQPERPWLYLEKGVPKYLFSAIGINKREHSVNIAIPLR